MKANLIRLALVLIAAAGLGVEVLPYTQADDTAKESVAGEEHGVAIGQTAEDSPGQEGRGEQPHARGPERLGLWFERLHVRSPATCAKNHSTVKLAFREAVTPASRSTVRILSDGEPRALGTVADAKGHIVTKASELEGDVTCELHDGRELAVRTVRVDPDYDLAVLEVDPSGLVPVRWAIGDAPAVGSWLATPGLGDEPLAVGVVGVAPRKIPSASGALGVLSQAGRMHHLEGAQRRLVGQVSRRRSGFPRVLQHDSILQPADCGGPIVDLDGKAVGVNIARAGRAATYAVPADAVKAVLAGLDRDTLAAGSATGQVVAGEEATSR